MTGELVLITGATGFLGHQVLLNVLEAEYRVRACIRSQTKADKLLDIPVIKAREDQLEFVIVPDILADDAYDEAVKGATHIIHIASPMPGSSYKGEDLDEFFVRPAVKGSINILNAAQKAPSVKRIVHTASIFAILPWAAGTPGTPENGMEYNEKSRIGTPTAPFPAGSVQAYAASKVASLNEVEAWMAINQPSFDLISILPGYIFGSSSLAANPKEASNSTNGLLLRPILGGDSGSIPGVSIDVSDTARAHLKALDPSVPGNRGYLLTVKAEFGQLFGIVAKHFAEEVRSGMLPNNGRFGSVSVNVDSSESERLLGFRFRGFEEQVKNTVGHYVQLVQAATVEEKAAS